MNQTPDSNAACRPHQSLPNHIKFNQQLVNLDFDFLCGHNVKEPQKFADTVCRILHLVRDQNAFLSCVSGDSVKREALTADIRLLRELGNRYHESEDIDKVLMAVCDQALSSIESADADGGGASLWAARGNLHIFLEGQIAYLFRMVSKYFNKLEAPFLQQKDWKNLIGRRQHISTESTRIWDACAAAAEDPKFSITQDGDEIFSRWYDITQIDSDEILGRLIVLFNEHPFFIVLGNEMSNRAIELFPELETPVNFNDPNTLIKICNLFRTTPKQRNRDKRKMLDLWMTIAIVSYPHLAESGQYYSDTMQRRPRCMDSIQQDFEAGHFANTPLQQLALTVLNAPNTAKNH